MGWVPATGTAYGAAPSVALSEAYAQSNAHAHASSVASGSNNIYSPIYYKGLGSQSAVSSASAHSSVGSAISKGLYYQNSRARYFFFFLKIIFFLHLAVLFILKELTIVFKFLNNRQR